MTTSARWYEQRIIAHARRLYFNYKYDWRVSRKCNAQKIHKQESGKGEEW